MLKINIRWKKPFYNTDYSYKERRVIKRIEEHSKTTLLLTIEIKGLSEEIAKEVLVSLADLFNNNYGSSIRNCENLLLSNQSWGERATYDASSRTYTDALCIPKKYGQVDAQKKDVMWLVRVLAREVKKKYATQSVEAGMMHYDCEEI